MRAFLVLLLSCTAAACSVTVQAPGLVAIQPAAPGAMVSGLAVLPDGSIASCQGASVLVWSETGQAALLATLAAAPVGAVLAVDPTGTELWIGEWTGPLLRLPLAGGAPVTIAAVAGLGAIGFDTTGRAMLAMADASAHLDQIDAVTGARTELYRDPAGLVPPAFGFLPGGELLIEQTLGPPGSRLISFSPSALDAVRLGGAVLAPGGGAPWSRTYPELTAVCVEGGGGAIVLDGSAREIFLATGTADQLLATGCPPVSPSSSSYIAAMALTPGAPVFSPGGGASPARLALSTQIFDAALSYQDGALEALLTTLPGGLLCGDADADGDVDVLDALVVARAAAGLSTVSGLARLQADVDASGDTSILDALLIAQTAAGLPATLAC